MPVGHLYVFFGKMSQINLRWNIHQRGAKQNFFHFVQLQRHLGAELFAPEFQIILQMQKQQLIRVGGEALSFPASKDRAASLPAETASCLWDLPRAVLQWLPKLLSRTFIPQAGRGPCPALQLLWAECWVPLKFLRWSLMPKVMVLVGGHMGGDCRAPQWE